MVGTRLIPLSRYRQQKQEAVAMAVVVAAAAAAWGEVAACRAAGIDVVANLIL